MNPQTFRKKIWNYYRINGRNLPWRRTRVPYKILISEIMLQQTQASRVLRKYPEFLKTFPNARALAKAPLGKILRVWQGMGYNRRAIALKRLAEKVIKNHRGKVPLDFESLTALPGVGSSTAGAVLAFAADAPVPFVETNIRRVFIHFFFEKKRRVGDAEILRLVAKTLPKRNVREWYWALMDYGAMLGTKKLSNPNRRSSRYAKQSVFRGSNRQVRGRILELLVKEKILSQRQLRQKMEVPSLKLRRALDELTQEGFLAKTDARYALAR